MFQSSEVGLFAGLQAAQKLTPNKQIGGGGRGKVKVAFICHNIKEVSDRDKDVSI